VGCGCKVISGSLLAVVEFASTIDTVVEMISVCKPSVDIQTAGCTIVVREGSV
jgi:hypothetical protein